MSTYNLNLYLSKELAPNDLKMKVSSAIPRTVKNSKKLVTSYFHQEKEEKMTFLFLFFIYFFPVKIDAG